MIQRTMRKQIRKRRTFVHRSCPNCITPFLKGVANRRFCNSAAFILPSSAYSVKKPALLYGSALPGTIKKENRVLTHAVTHERKNQAGKYRTGPDRKFPDWPCIFCHIYRICWLMTPPMVSAASCFICAVAWV